MDILPDMHTTSIWFHGASVGDLKSLKPIVNGIQAPMSLRSMVTYWTREASLIAPVLFESSVVRRAPAPFQLSTRRFLHQQKIKCCVMEYLELFPGWVKAAVSQNVPMGVINGRVTSRSLRVRGLLRSSAAHLDFFWAQTERDAENAKTLGVPTSAIEVLGSTKRSMLLHGSPPSTASLRQEIGQFGVVVGSVHPDEERKLVAACLPYGDRALIAPRYLSQSERLYRHLRRSGVEVAYRTDARCSTARVVILNTIGELHAAYGLAPISIVGGTFGRRGGQNLLEPITMGKPVVYGPRHHRVIEEASALRGVGGVGVTTLKEAFKLVESTDYPSVDIEVIRRHFPDCIEKTLNRLREIVSS